MLFRVLQVTHKGYYKWLKKKPSKRDQENARLEIEIIAQHEKHFGTYGPIRLQPELKENNFSAGIGRIIKIRKKLGISCKQKKKFKATTDSKHNLPVYDNLLKQKFVAVKPCQIWVSDITYISTEEGWLYLAGIKDMFNCEIVGYSMGERITKELVINALKKAVKHKKPGADLICHSDRGSQYCSHEYRRLLKSYNLKGSMSGKGNCYDNAPIESF